MSMKRMAKLLACYSCERGDRVRVRADQRLLFGSCLLCLSVFLLVYGDHVPPISAGELSVPPLLPQEPQIAYLYGGKLYYLHIIDRYNGRARRFADHFAKMEIWKARVALKGAIVKEKQQMPGFGGSTAREGVLFRWRICHGHFCSTGDKVAQSVGFFCCPLNKISILHDKLDNVEGTFGAHLIPITELVDHALAHGGKDLKIERAPLDPWAITDAFFDFLLSDKNEIHTFVAWRGQLYVWRGIVEDKAFSKKRDDVIKMHSDDSYIKWDNVLPAKPADNRTNTRPALRLDTKMREAFMAFQSKNHFFFVTESGKLYATLKHGDQKRTESLWDNFSSPICAVLHDTVCNKTFAFTKPARQGDKEGRNVWFELAPKLEPISYDPKKIPQWKSSDPLPTMMEYARILLREMKIKVEN